MQIFIDNKLKLKKVLPTIKERQAFQVGRKLYKTKEAAARGQAWNWLLLKYHDIKFIKRVGLLECSCGEDEKTEYGTQYGFEDCPLHNRYNGYFKRLHTRLTGIVLHIWSAKTRA
jgi:hypothetical protein